MRKPSLFILALVITATAPHARAQVSASLNGIVSDPSGARISGAEVSVKNSETRATRAATTNGEGRYEILALPVGEYELTATKSGFQPLTVGGIHLVVAQEARVDLSLHVGPERQQVLVEADASLVSTTTSDISGYVGQRQINELPLNGRSYDLLLPLNPGVVNFTS